MNKSILVKQLRQQPDILRKRYGIRNLMLFGSIARNEATQTSDVDLLVNFDTSPRARQFFELQFYLEDLLGRPVDLVTDQALCPELRPYIEKDLEPIL